MGDDIRVFDIDGRELRSFAAHLKFLAKLVQAVTEMRKYQKLYFKNRLSGDLHIAKQWEAVVDKTLDDMKRAESPAPEATQDPLL